MYHVGALGQTFMLLCPSFTVKPNGYIGQIEAVEEENDGTRVTLANAPD